MALKNSRKFEIYHEKGKFKFEGENLSKEELNLLKKTLFRQEIRWWVKTIVGFLSVTGIVKLLLNLLF